MLVRRRARRGSMPEASGSRAYEPGAAITSGSGSPVRMATAPAADSAIRKSKSTGSLTSLLSLDTLTAAGYFKRLAPPERVSIRFEGDGALGILWIEDGQQQIVANGVTGVAAEWAELEPGMALLEVNGKPVAKLGFKGAMRRIATSWQKHHQVELVFSKAPQEPDSPQRPSPPSLAGMVELSDEGCESSEGQAQRLGLRGSIGMELLSPIHEAHRKGSTPRRVAMPRSISPPPELSLVGMGEDEDDEDEVLVTPPAEGRPAATTQKSQELQAVRTFLGSCDCANSYQDFEQFGVSRVDDFRFVTPSDLPTLGLTPPQCRRLLAAISDAYPTAQPEPEPESEPEGVPEEGEPAEGVPEFEFKLAEATMGRSPSQVFELAEPEVPALSLDAPSPAKSDKGARALNVFISPLLGSPDAKRELSRIRTQHDKEEAERAQLHWMASPKGSAPGAWASERLSEGCGTSAGAPGSPGWV
eukprot:COSAG04_NODE_2590_length_3882_cov_2.155168_2_plen_473_part_00